MIDYKLNVASFAVTAVKPFMPQDTLEMIC
jgi:hypothetical protein